VALEGSVDEHDGARVRVVVVFEFVIIANVTYIIIAIIVVIVVERVNVHRFRVVLLISVGMVHELLPVTEVLQEIVGAHEEILNTVPTLKLARLFKLKTK
jgi:hypothetical protein